MYLKTTGPRRARFGPRNRPRLHERALRVRVREPTCRSSGLSGHCNLNKQNG